MISLITFLSAISQVFVLVSRTHAVCNVDIRVEHGRVAYGDSHYKVYCDSGYVLDGRDTIYCIKNDWQTAPPRCYEESQTHGGCNRNIYIQHGWVEYSYSNYKAHCDPGYVLDGSGIVYCVKGEWERSPPICFADSSLKVPNMAPDSRPSHSSSATSLSSKSVLETTDSPCKNFGGCQHICKNVDGRAQCRCRQGYTLAADGKKCIEGLHEVDDRPQSPSLYSQPKNVDPCHNHQCDQICKIENGKAQCRCKRGYILNQEDQRTCEVNTGPPIHPSNPCQNNNGGCDQKCSLIGTHRVVCGCNPGYTLDVDRRSCIASKSVPRPTSCYYSNGGCQHTCAMRGQNVICSCPPGYKLHSDGKSCRAVITVPRHPSCNVNNGGCQYSCSMRGYTVECSCPPGYTLHVDGKSCLALPRETCEVNNGGCGYYCSMGRNGVVCSCPRGYRLAEDRKHCVDIDECKYERLNTCHHICENTEGSYTCSCHPGYIKIDNKCEGCRKDSYWSTEKNGCVDCPPNSFTLSEGKTSVSECFCRPGFTGSPAENIPCLDNDECYHDNFGCSHTCVNTPGGAFCSCPIGFEVDKDNKTCIDIDECSIKNGGCEGFCVNTNGSFYCRCPPGFKRSNKDQYSCDDVDECSENNGGCHQLCVNYRGGHYCTCKEGYRLDGSLKNCTDIVCPGLHVPHFSTKRCKLNSQVLPEMDYYPTGTVCTFKCMSGFKDVLSDSRTMSCLEDGTWEGSLSECKSQHCSPLKVPENGDVHPPSCETEGNKVKQKCTFTCHKGYKLEGVSVFGCRNNLSWDKPLSRIPVCKPEEIRASIECVRDINATLLPGQSTQNVTIPEPVTNMESYAVSPSDIIIGKPTEFAAGKTKVVFTASSPSSNRTAKCVTTVHVIDEESPVFLSCPKNILIENARIDGELVTWDDPEVIDNVRVKTLVSSVEPNTTFIPGSYVVEYVARDVAGNSESCSFKIDVVRLSCDDLKDPAHGEANCMDWIYGRLCQPLCDDGYMRDPSHSQFYSCGDSGKWEPSDNISECLPFTDAVSSKCPDGKELKIIEETDEEICLECPSNAVWSPATQTCEKTTT